MMQERKENPSMLDRLILFCLDNKLIVLLVTVFVIVWGVLVAPFDWDIAALPRDPVPVDAIPDIGENQQIVFTNWAGRSPQDIEDQITYPLTVALLGVPGVRTIRSFSNFGFSSLYLIFEEDVEFYWSRSRVLEKLNSLPTGTLPEGVSPALGPDATALGQIFWYTLEGHDPEGNPVGGWDLHELRTTQDFQVRYALQGVKGVAEVASIGGFVQEYQIDVDPDAMRAYGVTLGEVFNSVRMSNADVGAKTIEINRVEYIVRGIGFIKNLKDIENSVIKMRDGVPILIRNVATVALGPAMRRGALDKAGVEAVGGVVVARYGANPMAVIDAVKERIESISASLPRRTLEDGTESQITIVPFYDRSVLIRETLGTLNRALYEEILVTIIVVLLLVMHLRSSILISGLLPIAVLMCFIAMKYAHVDANIVALSGIAIAIGTMVDMGIVICENILRHLDEAGPDEDPKQVIFEAVSEVGSAVITAVMTTIVGFLPVFAMDGAEGKLFKPLAFTKTFAIVASIVVALTIIPAFAHMLFARRSGSARARRWLNICLVTVGIVFALTWSAVVGTALIVVGVYHLAGPALAEPVRKKLSMLANVAIAMGLAYVLASEWVPLGPALGAWNFVFVALLIGVVLGAMFLLLVAYEPILRWCLENKILFLSAPVALVVFGAMVWMGFSTVAAPVTAIATRIGIEKETIERSGLWIRGRRALPGLGKEFMPPLDEGSFLYMPSAMPHASIGASLDILKKQDMAIRAIPEVASVVGKLGRVDSPLDPAPVSMFETVVNYKTEYKTDANGRRLRFRYDRAAGSFARDGDGELIPDARGRPFRQWRDSIQSPDDIWKEIVRVAQVPGATSSPKLQPIETRLVMMQTGMRAPMGVKVQGPDLESIERASREIERLLKQIPEVEPATVLADRVVGKPYLEIEIDREAIARYGMHVRDVQDVIEVAVGGRMITTTVEGRERYPVRVRYPRELRGDVESLTRVLVAGPGGIQIPLAQLAKIEYRRGPQAIKSEDTFLTAYVVFDRKPGLAEVDVVETCQRYLNEKRESGEFVLPAGVSYRFAGSYENQIRSEKKLRIVLPVALFIIFMILYMQFRSIPTSLLVFAGILVAWAGGFVMIWLYGQSWFMNFDVFGVSMRDLFQVRKFNLSVAVWVGFLALFGIASDNGVIVATYLKQRFASDMPATVDAIREATVQAAKKRIRPCLMTNATTILALLPVLTSTGRGADVMVPMAIPSFGGMCVVMITVFVVPTLYCAIEELKLRTKTQG